VSGELSPSQRRWRRLFLPAWLAGMAFAAILPLGKGEWITCPMRHWLGLPCLLCGGTRAAKALALGDWQRALYLNPWTTLALVLAGIFGILFLLEARLGRRILPAFRWTPLRIAAVIAILLVCWVQHMATALSVPKPELLNPQGLFFQVRAQDGGSGKE